MMGAVDKYLGHPAHYWIELERWASKGNYGDLVEELADLRAKIGMYESFYNKLTQQREVLYR